MSSQLQRKTISGIIWSSLQRFGTLGINLISNIVLARLLAPEDYGCIGMLMIFIALSNTFVDGGFVSGLIQKKNPTQEDYSTIFYWNIFISVFFYVVLYISAPIIASFYEMSILTDVLRVLGLILFINALSIVQIAILRRQLQFKKISIIQAVSVLISVITTIVLAYKGWGVWALVTQQLLCTCLITIGLWLVCKWYPVCSFSFQSFKELFSYSAFLLFSDLLNNLCDNIQGLIIGKKYTPSDMGFYTQAKKFEAVPTQSISYVVSLVAFPVFAKLQDDKEKLNVAVRKCIRFMNFLNFPLMILLILIAEPLFIILFSDKWCESIPYFRILCLAGIVNCLQSVNYQVVCAVGRSKEIFKWNVVKRVIDLGLIVIGMYWGIEGMLCGMVTGFYITFIINAMVATSSTGYTLSQQIKDAFPILFIATGAAFVVVLVNSTIGIVNHGIILWMSIIIYIIVYLFLSKIFHRMELVGYKEIIESYIKR